MSESRLSRELAKARHLLATRGPKPMFPQISLEVRQSLAKTLSTEESIDHLTAVKRLHRPIADEIPLWEEYTDLAEWLDEIDAEDREAEALMLQYQEECEHRLQEALRDFDLFMSKYHLEQGNAEESRVARRTISKDDLQVGITTGGGNELRRRPSFMADISQGHIQVEAMETNRAPRGNLPTTSTPHVPHVAHRRPAPRVSDVKPAANLFDAGPETESSRPRAASFTRIEYVRSKTFERKADKNESDISRAPEATFVTSGLDATVELAGRTVCKEPNATILKSSSATEEPQNLKRSGNVPRIAPGPGRPAIATRTTRETKLQKPSKFSSRIQVLPSKASSGVPARQLPSRKAALPTKESASASSVSGTSSSSRSATAITRPSKPARLPQVRK